MSMFSERLKKVRKERGKTRQAMADLLNITLRAYQFYEEGKREPPYDRLVDLARELNVSIDYLLGLKDEPI